MRTGPAQGNFSRKLVTLTSFFFLGFATCLFAPPAQAQGAPLAGKYFCMRVELGNHSERCQSPELVLHRDGTYEIWGEHGTYSVVQGRWLVLSHSKRRGLGHFEDPREIVFEYRMDGQICRVTFRRLLQPPPGFILG